MTKFKKASIQVMSFVGAASLLAGVCVDSAKSVKTYAAPQETVRKLDTSLKTNQEAFYDSNVVYKLPETVKDNQSISVIVAMNTDSVVDSYDGLDGMELTEYVHTKQAKKIASKVESDRNALLKKLNKSGVRYTLGEKYDTVLSGFEITVKAKDFEKVNDLLSSKATLIVGEEYEPAKAEVVTNDVDVYETGIFDSSSSEYQGDGVVVAVLDSGLDYTHTAFSDANFTTDNEAFTKANLSDKVVQTVAASFTPGLKVEDVYVGKKVPFAYDYADKDTDVLPTNSEHGTHVSGVIAGKDEKITGVAPNAQIAFMKVFSDKTDGAKSSWLLAALEDCVTLGVDVINMSLGSSCGFAREVDKKQVNEVYDSIRAAGISLVVAASNDYNATMASEKNGALGLTSNPDFGTVGSPSTYGAALSVASVDGVKTPYLPYKDEIIYFNEASTASAELKDFVDDILKTVGDNVQSHEFPYVTIPGVGRSSDYPNEPEFYKGKIVLVKRGTTTFEDKVRVALKEMGASGIIIYNNVSGSISMSVGEGVGAVCSITQDDGEMLAAAETGKIKISRSQLAGPFMSDFSSWGPTSDLQIKPEITAHGGEILSAVPGQGYDRQSGTSMAAPNQAGATALIRQYVKETIGNGLSAAEVTAIVNRLMMSTTDIVYDKNGLPSSVRKQGSGLVNIAKATSSAGYITTYDGDVAMDKTKLELGDDKDKTGVYEMTFGVTNVSGSAVSYDVDSIIMTEGVSETYTSHGDTTVTQEEYLLSGTQTTVTSVVGGTQSGNRISLSANSTAKVTVRIVLSDADKQYLEDSFAHGMYVEGYIKLDAVSGTNVDMNVAMLTFFGDWTEAPIFDEEYYDTQKDAINAGIDPEDKLMADLYDTRVIGGLYSDYITTLGDYYFEQDPSATQIAADKKYIAISNQEDESNMTVNSIYGVWAGLLRNVKEARISIVEDSTGEEIFFKTESNVLKTFSSGNSAVASSIDIDFHTLEHNLKNNTRYTVTITTYIDYGEFDKQANVRNTFTFPLFIDFQAPVVTDVEYRTEYDKTTEETKLFADLSVYDNHYAMALQAGQVVLAEPGEDYTFSMKTFGKYLTPVYSSFNSTTKVTIEMTDYVAQLKESAGIKYNADGSNEILKNNNSFIVVCYDYALNSATYEIRLPDESVSMLFKEEEIKLNPNETQKITDYLDIFPGESWMQALDYSSSDPSVVDIVNQTLIAKKSGTATITVSGKDALGQTVSASTTVKVLSPEDEGYRSDYTIPEVNKFTITGYHVNKAYYSTTGAEREIGLTDYNYEFDGRYYLSMFPSESVTLQYSLDSYFPDKTGVTYTSGNEKIATVSKDGTIVALAKGTTIVTVQVTFKDDPESEAKPTIYTGSIAINVKDPFTTNGMYLMSYKGLGGEVVIPADRGITMINSYAFANFDWVEKDLSAGDVIDEEDPYNIKQGYLGEDTITKVVVPEGVESIEAYAFAALTALEEVVLPSTLTRIGRGAFVGCTKLKTINLEHVQFINESAFKNCALEEVKLDSMVAIGDYAFEGCKLNYIVLPTSSQSLGIGAFYGNEYLMSVEFKAPKIKVGTHAFAECTSLGEIDINAAVLSAYAFYDCSSLTTVKLGKDVAVIGEFAFAGTKVSTFEVHSKNTTFSTKEHGALVYKGEELVLVAPQYAGTNNAVTLDATSIADGAFAGNVKIFRVVANQAKTIGAYAFAECTNLVSVEANLVTEIGEYAFYGAEKLSSCPNLAKANIGDYAFAGTALTEVTLGENITVGDCAFAFNPSLETVTVGNGVTLGEGAFYCPVMTYTYEQTGSFQYYNTYVYEVKDEHGNVVESNTYYRYDFSQGVYSNMRKATIGENVTIGAYAFYGNSKMNELTLGVGTKVGDYAFFNATNLETLDLSGVKSVGEYAFSGSQVQDYAREGSEYTYAYTKEYIDGEIVITDYKYSFYAPAFTTADLSNATELKLGAFAYNDDLQTVKLGAVKEVPAEAFANCYALTTLAWNDAIVKVGDYAFFGTAVQNADLSKVEEVGAMAFAKAPLTEVTFKTGAKVGDSAFANAFTLAKANNLENVVYIGESAFMNTALTEVKLTKAEEIGSFAFFGAPISVVDFGTEGTLKKLGDNPFAGCPVETFAREEKVDFGGSTIGTKLNDTYDVSDTVKVIGGVLYQTVPNGLELVSYPAASMESDYVVEEGTVKVSAKAFAYSYIQNVTLPTTLKALGDKAFFGCYYLYVVVFTSYEAPLLEEEYDLTYLTYENMPFTGTMGDFEGLGISPFYMWNVESAFNNFYFGSNFVDYIGHNTGYLVAVTPSNGQNYDTFVMSKYFRTNVQGSPAAMEDTVKVIAMIAALPEKITLADEAKINAARAAYDQIPSLEQKALVTNYSTLEEAEAMIRYLKTREEGNDTPEKDKAKKPSAFVTFLKEQYGLIVGVVCLLALGGYITVTQILARKKRVANGAAVDADEKAVEEQADKSEEQTQENGKDE